MTFDLTIARMAFKAKWKGGQRSEGSGLVDAFSWYHPRVLVDLAEVGGRPPPVVVGGACRSASVREAYIRFEAGSELSRRGTERLRFFTDRITNKS